MIRKTLSLLTMAVAAVVMFLATSAPSQAQSLVSAIETTGDMRLQLFVYNSFGPASGTVFLVNGADWFYGVASSLQISGDSADIVAQGYLSGGRRGTITLHVTGNSHPSNSCSYQLTDTSSPSEAGLTSSDFVFPANAGFIAIY